MKPTFRPELITPAPVPAAASPSATIHSGPASTSARQHKTVQFRDGPAQACYFDSQAPPMNSASSLAIEVEWQSLDADFPYPKSSPTAGFRTFFDQKNLQVIVLRPRVLQRFKSVQEYEKRRQKEVYVNDAHPSLGQLEYGNADFKISLQAGKVVTAHDIGTYRDAIAFCIPQHLSIGPCYILEAFRSALEALSRLHKSPMLLPMHTRSSLPSLSSVLRRRGMPGYKKRSKACSQPILRISCVL
jgi:hypothetical protein